MDGIDIAALNDQRDRLLAQKTIIMTALTDEDAPEMGVTPLIRFDGGLYIYPSRLSSHVRALLARRHGQFLLIEDEATAQNIWARKRMKFNASIEDISRDDPLFDPLCEEFAKMHGPTMNLIRDFSDFHMLKLTPLSGVLVTGFANAYAVSGADLVITEHLKAG